MNLTKLSVAKKKHGFFLFILFLISNRVFSPLNFLSFCNWVVVNQVMTDYKVEMIDDGMQEFFVQFHKPKHSKFLASLVSNYFYSLALCLIIEYD